MKTSNIALWLLLAVLVGYCLRYITEPHWTMQLDHRGAPFLLNTRTGKIAAVDVNSPHFEK